MRIFCDCLLQFFAGDGGAGGTGGTGGAGGAESTGGLSTAGASSDGAENAENTVSARTADSAEKPKAQTGGLSERGGEAAKHGESLKRGESVRKADFIGNMLGGVRESFGAIMKNAEAESVLASWRREEQATREIYPSFSMKDEIMNEPMFGTLLKSGVGVRRAYECVHLEEIIGSAIRYAVTDIGRKTALSPVLRQTKQRPGENSVLDRAASVTRTDVNSLTDRDIRRILSELSRGANISFS